jgi:pilus assembly protein CpaC
MKVLWLAALLLILSGFNQTQVFAQATTEASSASNANANSNATLSLEKQLQTEQIEVAVGLDKVLELNFDFNTQMSLADSSLLRVEPDIKRRKITLIGLKPGSTSLTVRDAVGEEKLRYYINVTSDDLSKTVAELRELIGDVEGIEIGIRGGRVFVGGEIVVPNDIKRVAAVLETFSGANILRLIEMSPQTQVLISREMQDELQKNNFKNVTVRVVNKTFWVEGTVGSPDEAALVQKIATGYLPEKIEAISSGSIAAAYPEGRQAMSFFLTVDAKSQEEKKEPLPKLVKISSQFVELRKDYNKVFGFKWAPLMSRDGSSITLGRNDDGTGTTKSDGIFSAVITDLFPRLNSMKNAGYGRVVHSGMVITKENKAASLSRSTSVPTVVGQNSDFSRPASLNFGLTMNVTPQILEEDNVSMIVGISVNLQTASVGGSPIQTSNAVNTEIMVKSTETAVLGGVMQSHDLTNYDKDDPAPNTPSANETPRQPLFGVLRSRNQSIAKNQYVVFITPEIVSSAAEATEEIKNKFKKRGR